LGTKEILYIVFIALHFKGIVLFLRQITYIFKMVMFVTNCLKL